MLERSGKDFDPVLVKVFINMLGIYPLGTLVLLNTNEMGIVVQAQEDTELIDRPRIFLLSYSDGEYRRGSIVDLREMDERTKEYKRSIVRTLDPNEYNINVAEFFIYLSPLFFFASSHSRSISVRLDCLSDFPFFLSDTST
jgi:hypothetical protein